MNVLSGSNLLSWPFLPLSAQAEEERLRWWRACYYPGIAEAVGELTGWRVVTGAKGSGKSVLLAALERRERETTFIIEYPPEKWAGKPQCWIPQGNHFAQIMAGAAWQLRETLLTAHERASALSEVHYEFLRWLVEKYLGERVFRSWTGGLPSDLAKKFPAEPTEDFFPSTTQLLDVQGQVDELVSVARRLGYQRVLVVSDVDRKTARESVYAIESLFSLTEVIQHPGFSVLVALPLESLTEASVVERARGRVSVLFMRWEAEEVWALMRQYLQTALEDETKVEQSLAIVEKTFEKTLLEGYGAYLPTGWIALAETMAYLVRHKRLSWPVRENDVPVLEREFYIRHIPIQVDAQAHGVWRGKHFIQLQEQLVAFLEVLSHTPGKSVHLEHAHLSSVAKTKNNLHSLASRTRKQIEPFPKDPIYLQHDEDGYRLEHVVRFDRLMTDSRREFSG
ncbi:MAG: hypothetical protein Fur0022_18000 [Anaerolineales bacterium]